MRKDKGLSGDLDRLPMLTWIMFLKFMDDAEQVRETEARLEGKRFRSAIERPYRWRDWAARADGITGDELIAFLNQEKDVVRPDGTKGAGLFAYLRSLQGANGGDRRDVVATVFRGTVNRMQSGYLLRDVLNLVNRIHFTSSEEIQVLGHLYESLLKEMRDAAGDSGEFYTPRPLVRFIVTVVDPRLGETVLDPAAGTGGFLVAAFEHLNKQCRKAEDHARLQRGTLFGVESKPLPYLLCLMNLLLHGLESPAIDPGNALRFPLKEIGDKDRVDAIVTNPPFGGEEERGILGDFPEDKQTTETALLFLQLIMRRLRRPIGGKKGGRCGMVVPNGRSSGTASAPGSRRSCSRSSTSTPSSACPMGSSRLTPASRPTSCSSTAPARRRRSGTTSTCSPRAERTTPRPSRSSSRNWPRASPGGITGSRTSAPGRLPLATSWPTAATSTSRTPTPGPTSNICHPSSSWTIS